MRYSYFNCVCQAVCYGFALLDQALYSAGLGSSKAKEQRCLLTIMIRIILGDLPRLPHSCSLGLSVLMVRLIRFLS